VGVDAALVITALINWQIFLEKEGKIELGDEFFMEQEMIEKITTLTEHRQRTALGILLEKGMVLFERKGIPPRYFYQIHYDQVKNIIISSIKLQTLKSSRFKDQNHQGLKVGDFKVYKDNNKRVNSIKDLTKTNDYFPSENTSLVYTAQSAVEIDIPILKRRLITMPIEFKSYKQKYPKDVLDIIKYWNMSNGLPHVRFPESTIKGFGPPTKAFRNVTSTIEEILGGTFYDKVGMNGHNRIYSKEEIIQSIDKYKLIATNPKYQPRNKDVFKRLDMVRFFFNPYSTFVQSNFIKCLHEEPKLATDTIAKEPEENSQLTEWIREAYVNKILAGQTREFTQIEQNKFIMGANLLDQTIKKLQSKLNMMYRPKEWAEAVVDSLLMQWGRDRVYIGHLGSNFTYSETLIRYLRKKGRIG
jgi:hypothetical protein